MGGWENGTLGLMFAVWPRYNSCGEEGADENPLSIVSLEERPVVIVDNVDTLTGACMRSSVPCRKHVKEWVCLHTHTHTDTHTDTDTHTHTDTETHTDTHTHTHTDTQRHTDRETHTERHTHRDSSTKSVLSWKHIKQCDNLVLHPAPFLSVLCYICV